MTIVAIVKTKVDYSDVESAVRKAVDLTGGIKSVVKPNQKVLLKPNLLETRDGETGATTDRRVVGALVKMVKEVDAQPIVGDSPGFRWRGASLRVLKETKMKSHCEALGAKVVGFDAAASILTKLPQAKILKEAILASPVLETDVLINIPKIKTHALTMFTGAVKNLFGTLPGGQKTKVHALASNPEQFAEILVDIYQFLKPQLTVMDAVVGLRGMWRTERDRVLPGLIIAGHDGVAVDAVAAKLTGFNPLKIPMLRIASQRGVGIADVSKIEVAGESLESLQVPRFARGLAASFMSGVVFSFLFSWLISREEPLLNQKLCTSCQHCIKVCPANAISFKRGLPHFDLNKCTRCFCCHELCPQRAISINRGFIVNRLLGGI